MTAKTHFYGLLFFCLIPSGLYSDDKTNLNKIISTYSELCGSIKAPTISVQKLMKDLKTKKVLFIDVREPEEQQVSTLPNAITEKEFLKNPEQHKEQTIVAYCTIGYRSGKFAEKFKQWKILNLEGGILAWSYFNGKVYKNGKETDNVHVYSEKWNFLNSKYKAVCK